MKLMKQCFNPCFNGFTSLTSNLARTDERDVLSFNPCFNGFTSLTYVKSIYWSQRDQGFNPCFNGFTSLTRTFKKILYL